MINQIIQDYQACSLINGLSSVITKAKKLTHSAGSMTITGEVNSKTAVAYKQQKETG